MKRARLEKTFIEELERIPNISIACQKSGLSRQTIYRWMKWDDKFKEKVDQALSDGVDNVSDLAESKLINHINSGKMRAIEFWLINNKLKYRTPKKPIDLGKEEYKGVASINMYVVDKDGKYNQVNSFEKIKDSEENTNDNSDTAIL